MVTLGKFVSKIKSPKGLEVEIESRIYIVKNIVITVLKYIFWCNCALKTMIGKSTKTLRSK